MLRKLQDGTEVQAFDKPITLEVHTKCPAKWKLEYSILDKYQIKMVNTIGREIMIKPIVNFFKESYRLSPVAFYCELVETILLVSASAILTLTVLDPATKIFIPLYLLGSILGVVSTIIRKAGFAIVLCGWFVVMNSIAMVQLFIL